MVYRAFFLLLILWLQMLLCLRAVGSNTVDSKSQVTDHNTTKEIIKKIDQLDGLRFQDKECQHCLRFSESENESHQNRESELLQQCAVDLCGPADKNPMYVLSNKNFDKENINSETMKNFNKKIKPVIEEVIQTELDRNKSILPALQEKLQNPESNIKAQEWDEMAELLSMQIMERSFGLGGVSTESESNKAPALNYLSDTERKGNTSYRNRTRSMMSSSVTAGLLKLSSHEKQRNFIKRRYKELLKDYKRRRTRFTRDDRRIIRNLGKALRSGRDLNHLAVADDLDALIKKSKGIFFCVDKDCKKWVLEELTSLHQDLKKSVSDAGHKQRLNRQTKHCQSVYNVNIQSARQADLYKQNFNKYVNKFMDGVFADYSDLSRKSYKNYMHTLQFKFPDSTRQDVEQKLVDDIKLEARNISSNSDNRITELIQNRNILTDEYSICPSPLKIGDHGDFFDHITDTVSISNFSCHSHDHGKQTLAHELAHALSHWFGTNKKNFDRANKPSRKSYSQYMKLRECANERYKTETDSNSTEAASDTFGHYDDRFRTEEDMADLISHQVFQDDSTLVQCSLLLSSGKKYEFLEILYPPPRTGIRMAPDTHSTSLLRVMMEAIHKRKKLSTACQRIVNLYSDRINFEPCF